MSEVLEIRKTLSANDVGRTGAHQVGILVPKERQILDFFPRLDPSLLNPRCAGGVIDDEGASWSLAFVHYNNALVTGGTRNEYRLTRMTRFFRSHSASTGDTLCFWKAGDHIRIRVIKASTLTGPEDSVIRHSGKWHVARCSR
jgi:hypothetical protein